MKRILIGGTHSGCGKTTITCAVLKAFSGRKINVSAFKCGPDYIDPMFHKTAIGVDSHNLDSFFCGDDMLKFLLNEYAKEMSVIEGVMGYYDGINGGRGSAHSVSGITDTPSVLVVNCRGMSGSVGAVISGFLNYKKNNIRGIIFNELPERLEGFAKNLCRDLRTEYLGRFPKCDFSIDSRHLGLMTPGETADIRDKLDRLGETAERYLDLDKILGISECPELDLNAQEFPEMSFLRPPVIAAAEDDAFCFQYTENLDLLKKLGCRVVKFSPLNDERIPDCDGMILCGGYPELYAKRLFGNEKMKSSIKERIGSGMPVIAECGGFMYLHERFFDAQKNEFSGVGIIPGSVFKTEKLQRFGYAEMTANRGNLLCEKGEKLRVHEFHYWDSSNAGDGFTARKADGREWLCGHCGDNFYGGFPHLYFYSDPKTAENFVRKAAGFGGKL